MPQCGFSAAVVGVLNHMGIKFESINVLQDQEIEKELKFSDWPTIPQLYVKKNLLVVVILLEKCMKMENYPNICKIKGLLRIK